MFAKDFLMKFSFRCIAGNLLIETFTFTLTFALLPVVAHRWLILSSIQKKKIWVPVISHSDGLMAQLRANR